MNKAVIIILLIIFDNTFLTADDFLEEVRAKQYNTSIISYFNGSFSRELNKKNLNNSIGFELFINPNIFPDKVPNEEINYVLGFNYRFPVHLWNGEITNENNNIFNIHCYFMPPINNWLAIGYFNWITLGFGTNISYNFNKGVFGIGPQIDLVNIFVFMLKFNITYRYNIYINSNNSHEIEFKIGIRCGYIT